MGWYRYARHWVLSDFDCPRARVRRIVLFALWMRKFFFASGGTGGEGS